jgi:hypothetical protein
MVDETWDSRELPILQAIYRARGEGTDDLNRAARSAVPDLEERHFTVALSDLGNAGFLRVMSLRGDNALMGVVVQDLTPAGLRVVGAWPSGTLADQFLKALADRAAAEEDPEQRNLLTRLLELSVDVGRGVLVGVLTHVTTRGL